MCTLVILRRPSSSVPVVIGANRDEMVSRPWRPPARHWPDRPHVIGGVDDVAGGTWMGVNDHGVVACILNREGTLGPAEGKRSRGELVLDTLDYPDARDAAAALSYLNGEAYRAFNLVIADNTDAYWVRNTGGTEDSVGNFSDRGSEVVSVHPIPEGLSFLTAFDIDDPRSKRTQIYRDRFINAAVPDLIGGDWSAWADLLGSVDLAGETDPRAAMCVTTENGFETVNSSLISLEAPADPTHPALGLAEAGEKPLGVIWRFAAGKPNAVPYEPVDLT